MRVIWLLGLLVGVRGQVDEKWKKISEKRAVYFCNNADYPFIECKKKDGEYMLMGGAFGSGVLATVKHDPERYGVLVYQNAASNPLNNTLPVFDDSTLVPDHIKTMDVFIKVVNFSAEQQDWGLSREKSSRSFEKEYRRGRAFSRFENNGVPLGPKIYDLRVKSTGEWHPIHNFVMFQELLDGDNAGGLSRSLAIDELRSAVSSVARILARYGKYLDSPSPKTWKAVMDAVRRMKVEVYLRLRLRLTMAINVLNSYALLWRNGVFHCDAHGGNLMFIKHYVTEPLVLKNTLLSGKGYVPGSMDFWADSKLSKDTLRMMERVGPSGRVGVPVYWFSPYSSRWIDPAFILDWGTVLNGDMTHINTCGVLRAGRADDLSEFYRTWVGFAATFFLVDMENILKYVEGETIRYPGMEAIWKRLTTESHGKLIIEAIRINTQEFATFHELYLETYEKTPAAGTFKDRGPNSIEANMQGLIDIRDNLKNITIGGIPVYLPPDIDPHYQSPLTVLPKEERKKAAAPGGDMDMNQLMELLAMLGM